MRTRWCTGSTWAARRRMVCIQGGHHFGVTLPFARLSRVHGQVTGCADFGGVGQESASLRGAADTDYGGERWELQWRIRACGD